MDVTPDQLRDARKAAGYTQAELAKLVGVSMRTVGNWERGDTPITELAKLRSALGSHLDIEAPNPLADVSDMALLAELGRRLDKASGQRAGQPSRLRPVPSWADPVAARELHEPKGVPEPPGEEDVSQDPDDRGGER